MVSHINQTNFYSEFQHLGSPWNTIFILGTKKFSHRKFCVLTTSCFRVMYSKMLQLLNRPQISRVWICLHSNSQQAHTNTTVNMISNICMSHNYQTSLIFPYANGVSQYLYAHSTFYVCSLFRLWHNTKHESQCSISVQDNAEIIHAFQTLINHNTQYLKWFLLIKHWDFSCLLVLLSSEHL